MLNKLFIPGRVAAKCREYENGTRLSLISSRGSQPPQLVIGDFSALNMLRHCDQDSPCGQLQCMAGCGCRQGIKFDSHQVYIGSQFLALLLYPTFTCLHMPVTGQHMPVMCRKVFKDSIHVGLTATWMRQLRCM